MGICFICEKSLRDGRTSKLTTAGKQGLLRSSIQRGNKKHEMLLRNSDNLWVHRSCQTNYRCKRNIAWKRRLQAQEALAPPSPSSTCPSSPPPESEDDFTKKCFICCERVPQDLESYNYSCRLDQGRIVHTVKVFSELRSTILPYLENLGDSDAWELAKRVRKLSDEEAVGVKYHRRCLRELNEPKSRRVKKRRRVCVRLDDMMTKIYDHVEKSSDGIYKVSELVELVRGNNSPDLRTVKHRLQQKYAENISVFDYGDSDAFVCFTRSEREVLPSETSEKIGSSADEVRPRETPGKIGSLADQALPPETAGEIGSSADEIPPSETPEEIGSLTNEIVPSTQGRKRIPVEEAERLRVVREAAAIILADIRSQSYETEAYPPLENFMKDVHSVVPESLRLLLSEIVMKSKRGSFEKWEKKCTAIAHAIISAVRPLSFFSTLQMGVGSYLYKKFGSRRIVELLSALGFCSNYKKVCAFEESCNKLRRPPISDREFSQFVFDNADFNVNTGAGHATLHEIGEIHYVTSSDPKKPATPETGAPANAAPPNLAQNRYVASLKRIRPLNHNHVPAIRDFMWLVARSFCIPYIAGWNGFPDEVATEESFFTSKILCVDPPASGDNTIRTTLLLAIEKCKAANQNACMVTFDLQLYLKAREIIDNDDTTSPIKHVILRLGGFHLIMSFLGSIGYIMGGSGLEDLFKIVFGAKDVEKIMSGHAFAKAIRGHILCHLVLAKLIIRSMKVDNTYGEMKTIIGDAQRSTRLSLADENIVKNIAARFAQKLQKIEGRGPTAKLWVQYFRMVTLLKQFIAAERSGDWNLHLESIQGMLPYFHASGKFRYAKAGHLYIQDMAFLRKRMPAPEYERFTKSGHFMIRRTHRFWSGIVSDISVEQALIRSIKSAGGLAQGYKVFDSIVGTWTLGSVFLQEVCEKLEDFCGVTGPGPDQNVAAQSSRIVRDNNDVEKICKWIAKHRPFPICDELRSISTGLVGNHSTNCHLSGEIGLKVIQRSVGQDFHSWKPRQNERVLPLATLSSSPRVREDPIPVDPQFIFRRMRVVKEAQKYLRDYMKYELSLYPLTLFSDKGMLTGAKSSMYDCFQPLTGHPDPESDLMVVLDGGFLLDQIVWDLNVPFSHICEQYIKYVREKFGDNVTVIFGGYSEDVGGSGVAEDCATSNPLFIDRTTICSLSREEFFANRGDKARFINMLKMEFVQSEFSAIQAAANPRALIVNTALEMSPDFDSVVIVGEDVDLLVLLTGLGSRCNNVFFRRPGNQSNPDQLYTPGSLKYGRAVRDNILFLHAFSGCDTTSAVHNMPKDKFLTTLEDNENLVATVELFKEREIDPPMISQAGEAFFVALYGGDIECRINLLRFNMFRNLENGGEISTADLPPTKSAADQHSLRTYFQVQSWLGIHHAPQKWGWEKAADGLRPVRMMLAPAPPALLRLMSCECEDDCAADCACIKSGLKCCPICSNCSEQMCENQPGIMDIEEDDVNDIDDEHIQAIHAQTSDEECDEIRDDQPTSSKQMRRG